MGSPLILIAEDDPEVRKALERIVAFEGYEHVSANDGAAALEAVKEHEPSLIILDVMMPYVDGLTVCRTLRARGDRTPVLMLTAREEIPDRVAGLDAGADDYVAKPFSLDELLARIRALLRRSEATDDAEMLSALDIRIDMASRRAFRGDRVVDLTKMEFELLELLVRNSGIVLERSVMYERIWGYDFESSSRSLDVHVGYLRRKLEEGGRPRAIDTVRGIGFVIRNTTP